jgi:hypothetical protein
LKLGRPVAECRIEDLGPDFNGGWIMNPANIVRMVRTPERGESRT